MRNKISNKEKKDNECDESVKKRTRLTLCDYDEEDGYDSGKDKEWLPKKHIPLQESSNNDSASASGSPLSSESSIMQRRGWKPTRSVTPRSSRTINPKSAMSTLVSSDPPKQPKNSVKNLSKPMGNTTSESPPVRIKRTPRRQIRARAKSSKPCKPLLFITKEDREEAQAAKEAVGEYSKVRH